MAGLTPNKKHKSMPQKDNMVDFNSMVDDYIDDIQSPVQSSTTEDFKLDVKEKKGEYIVDAEFAGYDKEDIQINFDNDILVIYALKKEEINDENEWYIHRERTFSSVERRIHLPNVAAGDIKASFVNGILQVHIPKEKELEVKKAIQIE
ncbi:Hsp20/alpha crystallin family protein [Acetobacterium bakii]|uniref:SHSP domain-containing protein n=1 Tax=Acetobacterium bakii TaxID=52689 RepID=A0A0L6TWF4_9FIRM|nr:Hsp20 family protein [Acetobacterium bakii]KNZ40593.1 hypothetical protein AKG39_16735 [Acetobacterium bakii]